ncbi:hypothetical protein SAMN05660748_3024 [Blastococcus aggregatus]|uniref:site-specific DNA-methyltransferase (adenine-specific) n=1 Tax=Blastococcus aggregatus TaxID=38502 RepID=A0A285V884_9ACTN|nr:restriction endonuclease subunit M [Blastococcus aggregatus]SOC50280.1 hypothetical protein SAMN05660748_3024 [Blastococcus aggregatus]
MAGSDAILIGEDWISEHFFTTDATSQSFQARVVTRRKAWDEAQAEARPAEDGAERVAATTRARFTQARRWLQDQLAGLGEPAGDTDLVPVPDGVLPDVYARLLEMLGYSGVGLHTERTGPVLRVSAPGMTNGAPLVIVEGQATGSLETLLHKDVDTLLSPYTLDDDKTEFRSVARTLSTLFVSDDAPAFALVLAGRFALVAERAKWAEGRYLAVDLQLVCERNEDRRGGEVDRALACISAESLAPDAEGDIWWSAVLEESVKHTVGVSKDLREGVRLSIEIIANELVSRRVRQGLPPLPADQAQPLAIQSLRFLYRILFLLYAEASPELGVLPVGSPEYERGYSLDRLRELTLVELASPSAQHGSHLYDSLAVLFRLVDRDTQTIAADGEPPEGLNFRSLRADLFRPVATAHIDDVGLGNAALQQVLRHLLLSKESKGKDRGFISYAELGINQLGAVYEGLMSYTGFFAETDLYEVAKSGDASKGSWVVPVDRADDISPSDFVRDEDPVTGEERPVLHSQGTFVFRLAGRERQQSASYYTPEVLTRFVVSQALEELLDQDGEKTPADQILQLAVCEPALGSGAFAIEAVRQLAEQYLRRRQDELGQRIEPDEYPRTLQQVKAFIALHNVYGVDFNATAVELAEISLWLDTMVEGLEAPWFGLHLRRGNSLIGARRATFRRDQVTKKTWLTDVPVDAPLTTLAQDIENDALGTAVTGRVHHFLLPSVGWGATADADEAKALAPEGMARLKAWRKSLQVKPTAKQVDALVDLAHRVEALWQIAYRRLQIAEHEIRRSIPVWGAEALPEGGAVQRAEIEDALADASGAYRRLRRVMDAWCALWFWPLTGTLTTREVDGRPQRIDPPTLDQWIDALQMLLGRHAGKGRTAAGQQTIAGGTTWAELGDFEVNDLAFASAYSVPAVLTKHPWLVVCEQVAAQQGFFHWELDFSPVFARGGFALLAGNPPWVQPEFSLKAALTEQDPRYTFSRSQMAMSGSDWAESASERQRIAVLIEAGNVESLTQYLRGRAMYPYQGKATADLYKSFLGMGWRLLSLTGVAAFVHSTSVFQEERADLLRGETYRRLRQLWHFTNERKLFEIGNRVSFVVSVSGSATDRPSFVNACYLLEPHTVVNSRRHDGSGSMPNIKDDLGAWDVRPHSSRIRHITSTHFDAWALGESGPSVAMTGPFMFAVNSGVDKVLEKVSKAPTIGDRLDFYHWYGIGETSGVREGLIVPEWNVVHDPSAVVLQGPHLSVQNPVFQERGPEMRSHRDWNEVNPEALPEAPEWSTGYQLKDKARVQAGLPYWGNFRADNLFRVAWRRRVGAAGIRTMQPAIIPPGVKHIETVVSVGHPEWTTEDIATLCGALGSVCVDFQLRVAQKADIRTGLFARLRLPNMSVFTQDIALRVLRLNCLNSSYAELWSSWAGDVNASPWTASPPQSIRTSDAVLEAAANSSWSTGTPLRTDWARRQALLELDALVALNFDISCEELIEVYRAQFGVLRGAERGLGADEYGRSVAAGKRVPEYDRETDMRRAYGHFEQVLRERS